MRRRAALATAIAALAAVTIIPSIGDAAAPPEPTAPTAEADAPGLQLVDQTFVLPAGDTILAVTLAGAALGPAPCGAAGDFIRVTAYRPVTSRQATQSAVDDPRDATAQYDADLCALARTPTGGVQLQVPVSAQVPADPATPSLRLATSGVVPVGLEVRRAGEAPERLVTFVDRLGETPADDAAASGPLQVAFGFMIDGGPTRQPDGSTDVTAADQAHVQELLDVLGAVPDAPVTVAIRPELVDGLAVSPAAGDRQLVADLTAALHGADVLALPYVSIDPTGAVRAGLTNLFQEQMTRGEDVLAQLGIVARRGVWLIDRPLGTDGAQLLRQLGVRLGVVLPQETAIALAPVTRQFLVDLDNGTLPASQVDGEIAQALVEPGADPTLTAYRLAAEILAIRNEALTAPPITGHNLIVTTPDGGLGDPVVTAKLMQILAATPQLSLVDLSSISGATEPYLVDGVPYLVPLPDVTAPDLRAAGESLAGAAIRIDATASMLPPGDARPAAWRDQMAVAASSTLDAAGRAEYLGTIEAASDAIRADVVPPSKSRFTLGGRHSTIRLTLRNDGPTDLTVRLKISSSKLVIDTAEQDRLIDLPAGQTQPIAVEVEARTNGEFPVTVEIVTPDNDAEQISPDVVLTARANALTGLGQLATGAFVLVLLTWWVQHFRSRRRRAAVARAAAA